MNAPRQPPKTPFLDRVTTPRVALSSSRLRHADWPRQRDSFVTLCDALWTLVTASR